MTDTPQTDAPRKSVIDSIRPFLSRPALVMILLGFSSGLPSIRFRCGCAMSNYR